jgi:hypothetical protein
MGKQYKTTHPYFFYMIAYDAMDAQLQLEGLHSTFSVTLYMVKDIGSRAGTEPSERT